MAYSKQQRRMIELGLRLSAGMQPKVRRALLEAMAVESNFHNYGGGDRDSEGVLQQRPSTGWGPASQSAAKDIRQFLRGARGEVKRGFRGSAGELAQEIQGSAFPERYDQRSGEVAKIMSRFGGSVRAAPAGRMPGGPGVAGPPGDMRGLAMGLLARVRDEEDAPDVSDLVGLALAAQQPARAAQEPGPGSGRSPGPGLTPGKAWGGSRGIAKDVVRGLGLARTGKRATKLTSSGNVSDHYIGNKDSFAYDNSGSVKQMDKAAREIAKRLGIRYRGGPMEVTVNRGGYRIQVLYRTMTGGNHFDHIHVGVDRIRTPG